MDAKVAENASFVLGKGKHLELKCPKLSFIYKPIVSYVFHPAKYQYLEVFVGEY